MNRKAPKPSSPESCPVCSEEVPRGAVACPGCGADHASGWGDDYNPYLAGANLPDDDFDHDEFVREEFGHSPKPRGVRWVWWVLALFFAVLLTGSWTGLFRLLGF